jgi:hypothetical protein
LVAAHLCLVGVAPAQTQGERDFGNARGILKGLLAKVPGAPALRLEPDPNVVVLLDSDSSGPRIRMNPAVLRNVQSKFPQDADRVLTVMFARFIGQIQAGQPVGGDVLYTLAQIDEASCRAVRLLGEDWYTRYLVEVFHRDNREAADDVGRLLEKCR